MKNLKNLGTVLSRTEQKSIDGGFRGDYDEPLCPTANAFECNPGDFAPGHVCCRGMCVLPTHGACEGLFF